MLKNKIFANFASCDGFLNSRKYPVCICVGTNVNIKVKVFSIFYCFIVSLLGALSRRWSQYSMSSRPGCARDQALLLSINWSRYHDRSDRDWAKLGLPCEHRWQHVAQCHLRGIVSVGCLIRKGLPFPVCLRNRVLAKKRANVPGSCFAPG